jgi:HEAT repeat protein
MKSSSEQLESRGYVSKKQENPFLNEDIDSLISLLNNPIPMNRTLAAQAIAMGKNVNAIPYLYKALQKETKLYSKLAINDALISFGEAAVEEGIKLLGTTGNHYKSVPKELFKKVNYPLPRDIIVRVLMRIGPDAMPQLVAFLKRGKEKQIAEAIDAIGYITYYNEGCNVYNDLIECFNKYSDNELILWKIYRALSACPQGRNFLEKQLTKETNERLKDEIKRSLLRMKVYNK